MKGISWSAEYFGGRHGIFRNVSQTSQIAAMSSLVLSFRWLFEIINNHRATIFGEEKVMLKRMKSGIITLLIFVAILPHPLLKASITVDFGKVVSGTVDPAGEVDTYIFSAIASDTVLVRMSRVSGSLWPALILYSPNGTELKSDYGSDVAEVNCTLAETGEYTVNASDYWGDYTGNYSIFFQRLNNPGNAISVKFGETISASIDPAGEVDTYVFSADAGDTILVRTSQTSGVLYPEVRLYAPNGTELSRHWNWSIAEINCALAENGNYTILAFDHFGDYTGNYSIFAQRLNKPGKAVHAMFGDVVSGSIDPAGDVDTYMFSAVAGDTVLARISLVSGILYPETRLYSPNGTKLMSDWSYDVTEINYTLAEDGNYTVLVHDYFGHYTGDYGIFVQRLNNPRNAVSIVFGETVLGSIDPAGDVDTYVFSAQAGDTLLVRASQVSGLLYPEVRLYRPDGTELGCDWDWDVAELTSTLVEDGNYTVLVHDYFGDYTGNYTLYLSEIVFEELTLGNPYVGNISIGEWHSFYVSVEADKNLLVTLKSTSLNGILELYGRYGQAPTQSDYDYIASRRNVFGNYELLISPTENGAYYFGVYGKDAEGLLNYTITASIVERYVSNIYPRILTNSTRATVHISGIGFTSGMHVELRNENTSSIPAETVVLSSSKILIAHFNLGNAPLGIYDIAITWSDSHEKIIQAVVEVCELREGMLYSLPELQMKEKTTSAFEIEIPKIPNLFVTLQKSTLVSYGNSWSAELSLLYQGEEIARTSGSHDLILHIVDPNSGTYTVNVTAIDAGSGILTVWTSLPELPLGEWVVGTIYCSYGSIWYQVEVPPEQDSLCFEAEAMGAWSHFDIYYEEYGSSNHWVSRQGTQTSIEIPNPVAGTYIVEFMDSAMLYDGDRWSEDQTRDVLIRADTTFSVEPPLNYLPTITSISPDRGGNTGFVTVEIRGGWLDSNATVSLTRTGYESIVAQDVDLGSDGRSILATFDLIGKEPGEYTLEVTNPDGLSATAPTQFIIEEGGEAELWLEVVGREQIRIGRTQTYWIRYGNLGNIDVKDVCIYINTSGIGLIRVEKEDGVVLIDSTANESFSGPALIWLPRLQGSEVQKLKVTVYSASQGSFVATWVGLGIGIDFIGDVLWNTYKHMWEPVGSEETLKEAFWECVKKGWDDTLKEWKGGEVPLWSAVKVIGERLLRDSILGPFMIGYKLSEFLYKWADKTFEGGKLYLEAESQKEASKEVKCVYSTTPEDKYGPTGFDMPNTLYEERKRFVPPNQNFYYTVDFWNKEDATAPACDVFVKDQLDADFDWSTFRFEEIGFLNWTVYLEPCQYFNVYVDTRPEMELIVNVEGTFDPETGEISWTFRSLDPSTMETPDDPMAGFLPPITESGYEVGWVCFSVNPKADLPTGTRIENQAFVNFDGVGPYNPAPKEGPFVNTIDSAAPTSWIKLLPQTITSPSFTLEWEGNDTDGSGIRDYTIYVSENGMNYVPLLEHTTKTSIVFNGSFGHTYRFFSCARDNVGNIESVVFVAEAATTLLLPPQFTTANLTVSPPMVEVGENVTISVLVNNTGGSEGTYQLVLKINGTTETTKNITLAAGASQNVTFIISRDTPGAYVVEVDGLTGEFTVEAVPTSLSPPWWIIGILVTAIILASITLYLIKTRKKKS